MNKKQPKQQEDRYFDLSVHLHKKGCDERTCNILEGRTCNIESLLSQARKEAIDDAIEIIRNQMEGCVRKWHPEECQCDTELLKLINKINEL